MVEALGGGKYAFFSYVNKRFMRVNSVGMDRSEKLDGSFPPNWTWEVIEISDVGNGEVAFWNPFFKAFTRANPNSFEMDKSGNVANGILPTSWV